jgi:4-amino-4-deoxychorismate lyase
MNPTTLCFETICVQHRQFSSLLPYHEARLNRTRRALYGVDAPLHLRSELAIPDFVDEEKHKCRVTYGPDIVNIEWERYLPRLIKSLRLVVDDAIEYHYKYKNRDHLNQLHAHRGDCDDVLIVKNGLITDTSYANVALFDGSDWHTPEVPLLPGTQRAFLLDAGIISPKNIGIEDLSKYSTAKLFNAMVGWGESIDIDIQAAITNV